MPASNSEARKRHEARCGCVLNRAGGFPLKFCDRHLPHIDPAAIGLTYDVGWDAFVIVPRCGIHGTDTAPDEHGNRRCVECDRDARRKLPHPIEAASLIRTVLDADAELGCGSVLVDHDGIDPHALLTAALRALAGES